MSAEEAQMPDLNQAATPTTKPVSEATAEGNSGQAVSRRGLLRWSVPAIVAVTLPQVIYAGSPGGPSHGRGRNKQPQPINSPAAQTMSFPERRRERGLGL
jgi:hypothetical protein